MNMIKKTLITLSLFASLGIHAQDVMTYSPNTLDEGIVYFLPKTHLKVIVTANKATYTPGELCQYAERYLKLQGVSAQPKEYWEIQDIFVVPIGIPDTNKVYAIKLKDKMVTSQVELTEDGIIKAINTTNPVQQINDIPLQNIQSERIDPRNFMTEEMLMSGSTGKMAELIAKEIYNIRESKNSLTRGQADYMPQDGAALKIMLENLDKQEKAFTEMFSGYTQHQLQKFTFYIEPNREIKDQVVFRFSQKLGVLESNNLAGKPIYINVTNESNLPVAHEEDKAKKKPVGVIYNIPGKAKVSIHDTDKKYFEKELAVTQFGETEVLTNNLFNKKVNTRVVFNPRTGGIVKIDKD
jgi:hypothetical protein